MWCCSKKGGMADGGFPGLARKWSLVKQKLADFDGFIGLFLPCRLCSTLWVGVMVDGRAL